MVLITVTLSLIHMAMCQRIARGKSLIPTHDNLSLSLMILALGFFYAQECVTPHIRWNAKPVILTRNQLDAKKLDDPNYDYEMETTKAIDNVASLADYKKCHDWFYGQENQCCRRYNHATPWKVKIVFRGSSILSLRIHFLRTRRRALGMERKFQAW